jgi:hypothetical protein
MNYYAKSVFLLYFFWRATIEVFFSCKKVSFKSKRDAFVLDLYNYFNLFCTRDESGEENDVDLIEILEI